LKKIWLLAVLAALSLALATQCPAQYYDNCYQGVEYSRFYRYVPSYGWLGIDLL